MKTSQEIEKMREQARTEQLISDDGPLAKMTDGRLVKMPAGWGYTEEDRLNRAYAEGAEAALLFALGDAGSPFPR